jgi:hypothetical protein
VLAAAAVAQREAIALELTFVAEERADKEPTLVERWLDEQQQWQRTVQTYLDSLIKNDDFLVHLGNAMRGSLLAGKPYPTPGAPSDSKPDTQADDRIDQVLFALRQIEGQIQDLRMTLDEMRDGKVRRSRKDNSPKHKAEE